MDPRPLQPTDRAEWLRMRAALWPDDTPEEQAEDVDAFLAAAEGSYPPTLHAVLVCPRPGGGLCGFVELSVRSYAEGCETDRVGYLEAWYVDPDHRRQGVGRRLIAASEAWARAQGCVEMASDAELDNILSQRAHERLGYAEVGRTVSFRKNLGG
ncbi:MAG TPA: GNAT family N-acetyltransferase [Chloroflexaceae bacterium]|nr:GNAT family N-acetyltransferase [Chloroflexaceae bacterium]